MNSNPKNNPITKKEEVSRHPDPKIDQDFKGYPHGPANDQTIQPQTKDEKVIADLENKDGEKRSDSAGNKKNNKDEQDSDGSANAFKDK